MIKKDTLNQDLIQQSTNRAYVSDDRIDAFLQNKSIKRIDCIIHRNQKMRWLCLNCNNIWLTTPSSVLYKNSKCPKCAIKERNKQKSLSKFYKVNVYLTEKNIILISPYTKASTKHTVQCKICNYIWELILSNLYNYNNTGCPNCNGLARVTNETVDNKLLTRPIIRIGNVINSKTKIEWKCLMCDQLWFATTDQIINSYNGCPSCNKQGIRTKNYFHTHPNKKNQNGILYLISGHDSLNPFLKIGITERSIKNRYSKSIVSIFQIKEIYTKQMNYYQAFCLEQQIIQKFTHEKYIPLGEFIGKTECFSYSQSLIPSIIDLINDR